MRVRHPFPKIWLMTDARFGDELLAAIGRLRFCSGVIFRHYELPEAERQSLFRKVRRTCRRRGHLLILASDERKAICWRADGFHQRSASRSILLHSVAVHNRVQLAKAKRYRADMILLSPLFVTKSHPGQRPLGKTRFNALAAIAGNMKVIALGGMTQRNAAGLNPGLVDGWAAIDTFRRKTD
jgi:thiamine-phosphate pyrophosphorylase